MKRRDSLRFTRSIAPKAYGEQTPTPANELKYKSAVLGGSAVSNRRLAFEEVDLNVVMIQKNVIESGDGFIRRFLGGKQKPTSVAIGGEG